LLLAPILIGCDVFYRQLLLLRDKMRALLLLLPWATDF